MDEFRLITLDPGHFHAALVQKEMYPGISRSVTVYAPLSADLIEHLNRVVRFNSRQENPTCWEMDIHAAPDFLECMLAERRGNIVVLSGRNRGKIGYIRAALDAGLQVLADKPWIIRSADLPALEDALAIARAKGLIAYDIMTERYEITTMVQRELINDAEIFGSILPGSEQEPAVYMESVHHILKLVAGVPNLRPVWYFDISEQGEALSDVGTHLVDLVQWMLFPERAIDYRADVHLLHASRWPTAISRTQFQQVTGAPGGDLDYYCNTRISYTLLGVHTKLDVLWRWEAPAGTGDTHCAMFCGSKSRIEVRQGQQENYRPEVYVVPGDSRTRPALARKIAALARQYPGIATEDQGAQIRVIIPDQYRVGHEAHFAQVASRFFEYLKRPDTFPAWESTNMLAKYHVTTRGVEMSRDQ